MNNNDLKFMKISAWQKVILYVESMNTNRMSYCLDMTYSHIINITRQMKKLGIVNIDKEGRINKLTLTKKGKKLRDACRDIVNELEIRTLIR